MWFLQSPNSTESLNKVCEDSNAKEGTQLNLIKMLGYTVKYRYDRVYFDGLYS